MAVSHGAPYYYYFLKLVKYIVTAHDLLNYAVNKYLSSIFIGLRDPRAVTLAGRIK